MSEPSRRSVLTFGAATAATAAVAGCTPRREAEVTESPAESAAVPARGRHQAGVVSPALPQSQLISQVYTIDVPPAPLLAGLGSLIDDLTTTPLDGVVEPGDLTVTVGVGPRWVRAVDPDLPGAQELPPFTGEQIDDRHRGGDLWIQVCGTNSLAVGLAAAQLQEYLRQAGELRWAQGGWRGPYESTPDGHRAGRNLQGFQDGLVNPRSAEDLDEGVWIAQPSKAAGGTIAVIRRFRMDLPAWRALGAAGQERAVGRRKASSMALSGRANVNLGAKTADGRYRIPVDAHVRRAHPLDVGVPTMLRRSYSIDVPEPGLLFVSFQNELRTFTATMQRLVESDAMVATTTTTATGSFLVLPGATRERPLGSTVFGAGPP